MIKKKKKNSFFIKTKIIINFKLKNHFECYINTQLIFHLSHDSTRLLVSCISFHHRQRHQLNARNTSISCTQYIFPTFFMYWILHMESVMNFNRKHHHQLYIWIINIFCIYTYFIRYWCIKYYLFLVMHII